MPKFTLEIEMGNAAMLTRADIAEALHKVARKVGDSDTTEADSGGITDLNGNRVGRWAHDDLPDWAHEEDDEG